MTREEKQRAWALTYKAHAEKFYADMESRGINTKASAVVREPEELPLIIQNQAVIGLKEMRK